MRVIAEELSEYLASRNIPAGWIPAALASKVPGLPEALADAVTKVRQLAVRQQNNYALTNAMAKDVPAPPLLNPLDVDATPYTDTYTS
ncbi:MAG: hypothetical protein WBW75_22290 [Mycobacterium sp.]|uniref:hypothetical protein n=1 Tax=Mycobacterium sp. TaxID=1785 RepID=UPI003C5CDBD7